MQRGKEAFRRRFGKNEAKENRFRKRRTRVNFAPN